MTIIVQSPAPEIKLSCEEISLRASAEVFFPFQLYSVSKTVIIQSPAPAPRPEGEDAWFSTPDGTFLRVEVAEARRPTATSPGGDPAAPQAASGGTVKGTPRAGAPETQAAISAARVVYSPAS